MTMTPFAYNPLESPTAIRLLVLKRGTGDDTIQCSLVHAELGTRPYQALSYEWGLPLDNDPEISVDGNFMRVRANLREALRQIRPADEDLTLWVDALCINQMDLAERSSQVQLMGAIFGEAACVIAWLGSARDDSDFAMQAIADPALLSQGLAYKTGTFSMPEKHALTAVFRRTYWGRVWMLQELYLARRLVFWCGRHHVSEERLKAAHNSVTEGLLLSDPPINGILHSPASVQFAVRKRKNRPRPVPDRQSELHRWLTMCLRAEFQSTEPRDLVYSLLGVSSNCQKGEIVPDYEKPLVDVYLEGVEKSIKGMGLLRKAEMEIIAMLARGMGVVLDAKLHERVANAIRA